MNSFGIVKLLAHCAAMMAMAFCVVDGSAFGPGQDEQVAKSSTATVIDGSKDIVDNTPNQDEATSPGDRQFATAKSEPGTIQLCQGSDDGGGAVAVAAFPIMPMAITSSCDGSCGGGCSTCLSGQPSKMIVGVDGQNCHGREPTWKNQRLIPWEAFAYGEYIGPHRTPDVGEYRIRINDRIEFVYLLTRKKTVTPYQLYVGDEIQIISSIDPSLNQTNVGILSDGTISLPLIGLASAAGKSVAVLQTELNEKYSQYVKNPAIVVQVIKANTPLEDLRDAVDSRFGRGGQGREAIVSPDGTVQLPGIGSIPAIGLTLDEIRREINARYRVHVHGIEVTPILVERAPRYVYVIGEVETPGRYELTGPTTVLQSIALASGTIPGGNVRQAIVFRRDQNWRLLATRLDLSGALYGRRPHPSDDVWIRDSDIVLIPKKPITRLSEAVNLYLTETLYAAVPRVFIWDLDFVQ